jgi:TetR/AcrR family transcriptional regulator
MANAESTWASRKLGAEGSATRAALIDAAQRLLLEEGYAAVTSRRVASAANLKPQLVHYYFRSMEDLLLEVLRRGAEQTKEQLTKILQSDKPVRALHEFVGDPRAVTFTTEFTALASRSEVIRAELQRFGEEFRQMQTEALQRHLAMRGIEPKIPPVLATVLLVSMANTLVREAALGMTMGHAEAEAFIEQALRQFEETGDAVDTITFSKWPGKKPD